MAHCCFACRWVNKHRRLKAQQDQGSGLQADARVVANTVFRAACMAARIAAVAVTDVAAQSTTSVILALAQWFIARLAIE
jgi:hypothetical protein